MEPEDLRARLDEPLHADRPGRTFRAGRRRYGAAGETGQKIGFITPLSHNFCESLQPVRITAPARSIPAWHRRAIRICGRTLRASADDGLLEEAILFFSAGDPLKPRAHDFDSSRQDVEGRDQAAHEPLPGG